MPRTARFSGPRHTWLDGVNLSVDALCEEFAVGSTARKHNVQYFRRAAHDSQPFRICREQLRPLRRDVFAVNGRFLQAL